MDKKIYVDPYFRRGSKIVLFARLLCVNSIRLKTRYNPPPSCPVLWPTLSFQKLRGQLRFFQRLDVDVLGRLQGATGSTLDLPWIFIRF